MSVIRPQLGSEGSMLRQFISPLLTPIVQQNTAALFDLVQLFTNTNPEHNSLGREHADNRSTQSSVFGFPRPLKLPRHASSATTPIPLRNSRNVKIAKHVQPSTVTSNEDIRDWVSVDGIRYCVGDMYLSASMLGLHVGLTFGINH